MESELSVRDVLTPEYVGVSESDTVLGAVRLMRKERSGCALVVRGSEPVGIVTEWDVLGLVADEAVPAETTVGEVMSKPVLTVDVDRSLSDAASTMARENIRHLVVEDVDAGEVVGVLTQRDVIAAAGSFAGTTSRAGSATAPVGGPEGDDVGDEALPNGGDEFSTQGVCEACGSLADSLREVNGQLVCPECRSV
ncbi:CBS domain-containing protein [Salinilacihabitans rarus]|uniref:CBS domain-containing protein n=1 Tax=Salinilacihabitans rarus TaxID=2961596 RepID=UPI0020C927FA|nr:CBS domain-containing protein [Salinilacihabitans rarus]